MYKETGLYTDCFIIPPQNKEDKTGKIFTIQFYAWETTINNLEDKNAAFIATEISKGYMDLISREDIRYRTSGIYKENPRRSYSIPYNGSFFSDKEYDKRMKAWESHQERI